MNALIWLAITVASSAVVGCSSGPTAQEAYEEGFRKGSESGRAAAASAKETQEQLVFEALALGHLQGMGIDTERRPGIHCLTERRAKEVLGEAYVEGFITNSTCYLLMQQAEAAR